MNDERVLEGIVTEFLLNTCRLHPQLSQPVVHAALRCIHIAADHTDDDAEAAFIPLTTGSVAEFYIEPMLPHIGDVDVMYHRSTELAIPRGHPPPTQLPAEFHIYVRVWEIIDSHLPGYVYLQLRYLLTECVDDDMYKAVQYERKVYYFNLSNYSQATDIHGPAMTMLIAFVVCCGHHKPLIGQHDTEATAGQTQQLLAMLSTTDVM